MIGIFALLKLVPLRDWLWAGLVVTLGIFATVEWRKHDVHEQKIGETKVLVQDKATADKATKQVAAGTATATSTETSNAKQFESTPPVKPAPDLSLRCQRAAPAARSVMPAAGTGPAPGADRPAADSGDGHTFDPVPALLARVHAADAQIVYLQGRIHELEKQMNDAP